ncbi:hypothetical protein [Crocosphaera sp.]|uniref:hypothetical protein n=1 Tax=Crocosphaera sp. TaxID=2729996 RepID=UPI003F229951|nr:hypothetical protein [Crocosphaera sp.]
MATKNVSKEIVSQNDNEFEEIMTSLEAARKLQDARIKHGSSGIENYVSDVEGDWLETIEEPDSSHLEETTSNSPKC